MVLRAPAKNPEFPVSGDGSSGAPACLPMVDNAAHNSIRPMPLSDSIVLFAPAASRDFGQRVGASLGVPLAAAEEREFDGGEHKIRPLVAVRGRSVYVVQSLFGDARASANDRLCRLLFFIGALRDAGARRVIACFPYLAYARKDQRTKSRDPTTSRYVAQLLEAIGTHAVIVLEVHNRAAMDNAFRIESQHLEATRLFARHVGLHDSGLDTVVVSPDIGGVKRARHFKELLESQLGRPVALAFLDKQRSEGIVTGGALVGEVKGRHVLLIDDLISSGTTLRGAIESCRRAGATRIEVLATHAAFSPAARQLFEPGGPDSIVVTDSVLLAPSFAAQRSLTVIGVAELFAEAIRRFELGGSMSELAGL